MRYRIVVGTAIAALAFGCALHAQQRSAARDAAQAAIAAAKTPAECVVAVREFTTARRQEVRTPTGWTRESLQKVQDEAAGLAKSCADRYDLKTIDAKNLAGLANLYTAAARPELANAATARAVREAGTLAPADHADVLVLAISSTLANEEKGAERNARLEKMVDELDALPGRLLDQRFSAHSSMLGYYRYDDIDAGIIRHSTWIIDAVKRLPPEEHRKYAERAVAAYVDMAEAWAGEGMNDKALGLLREAKTDLADAPNVGRSVDPEIDRYSLVGTEAAPLVAPTWLNMPDGTRELPMTGHVTLLEFSAHWCVPCKESYPGVNRLRAKYGPKGFRVAIGTQLYGYFDTERGLSPEAEIARDRAYFAEHGLDVPIAIGDQVHAKVVGGQVTYDPAPDPNTVHYKVGGIPQIMLIDRHGRIRLLMVGYDDANEARLGEMIERLLGEK